MATPSLALVLAHGDQQACRRAGAQVRRQCSIGVGAPKKGKLLRRISKLVECR